MAVLLIPVVMVATCIRVARATLKPGAETTMSLVALIQKQCAVHAVVEAKRETALKRPEPIDEDPQLTCKPYELNIGYT